MLKTNTQMLPLQPDKGVCYLLLNKKHQTLAKNATELTVQSIQLWPKFCELASDWLLPHNRDAAPCTHDILHIQSPLAGVGACKAKNLHNPTKKRKRQKSIPGPGQLAGSTCRLGRQLDAVSFPKKGGSGDILAAA